MNAIRLDRRTGKLMVDPDPPIAPSPPKVRIARRISNVDTRSNHPGFGTTPEDMVVIYRQADNGQPVMQYDLWRDQLGRDGHLRTVFEQRIQAVAGKGYTIQPGDKRAGSVRAAADLDAQLRRIPTDLLWEHLLTARGFGFSAAEVLWGEVSARIMPTGYAMPWQRRFRGGFTVETQGRIHFILGIAPYELIPIDEERGRWIIARNSWPSPWDAGLLRPAGWASGIKGWSLRDWLMFAEKFGIPVTIGFYEDGAGEETREALEDAVRGIGEDGYAILSSMAEIVIKEAARSGDATSLFPAVIAFAEAQQSKLFAGATLTNDSNGGGGSYGLGAVHQARSFELLLSDARMLSRAFDSGIAQPFVAWNGYNGAAPPRLILQVEREADLLRKAQIAEIFVGTLGLPVSKSQVYEDYGFKPPIDDEDTLKVDISTPPPAAPGGSNEPPAK